MANLQINIRKHKKLFGILGLVFIVCLECCIFPVGAFGFIAGVVGIVMVFHKNKDEKDK